MARGPTSWQPQIKGIELPEWPNKLACRLLLAHLSFPALSWPGGKICQLQPLSKMDLPPKRPSSHPPFNIDSLEASCTNQRIVQLKAQQLCSVNLSLSSIRSVINIKRTKENKQSLQISIIHVVKSFHFFGSYIHKSIPSHPCLIYLFPFPNPPISIQPASDQTPRLESQPLT